MTGAQAVVSRLGDAALSASFDGADALAVNGQVHALATAIRAAALPGVRDIVPGMRELVVHVDPLRCDVEAVGRLLAGPVTDTGRRESRDLVEIPVAYGGAGGPDLPEVASRCGLHVDDVCQRHAANEYVVCFLGFLPGFPYLGLLDPSLRLPRLATPRPRVAPGTVAIAAEYTGIYPSASPGGWHLIGHTTLTLFDPDATVPARLAPGVRVRFVPR